MNRRAQAQGLGCPRRRDPCIQQAFGRSTCHCYDELRCASWSATRAIALASAAAPENHPLIAERSPASSDNDWRTRSCRCLADEFAHRRPMATAEWTPYSPLHQSSSARMASGARSRLFMGNVTLKQTRRSRGPASYMLRVRRCHVDRSYRASMRHIRGAALWIAGDSECPIGWRLRRLRHTSFVVVRR